MTLFFTQRSPTAWSSSLENTFPIGLCLFLVSWCYSHLGSASYGVLRTLGEGFWSAEVQTAINWQGSYNHLSLGTESLFQ